MGPKRAGRNEAGGETGGGEMKPGTNWRVAKRIEESILGYSSDGATTIKTFTIIKLQKLFPILVKFPRVRSTFDPILRKWRPGWQNLPISGIRETSSDQPQKGCVKFWQAEKTFAAI